MHIRMSSYIVSLLINHQHSPNITLKKTIKKQIIPTIWHDKTKYDKIWGENGGDRSVDLPCGCKWWPEENDGRTEGMQIEKDDYITEISLILDTRIVLYLELENVRVGE